MSPASGSVIVGCLPAQARRVEGKCRGVARLRFVESRGNSRALPNGDRVVIWLKFVGHRYGEQAHKQWPRDCVHYHLGGLTKLIGVVKSVALSRYEGREKPF